MSELFSNFSGHIHEAGVDEVGRGCFAGPVVGGAVILPKDFYHPGINDSKKLSERQRKDMVRVIKDNAINWAVAAVSVEDIDKWHIGKACTMAMHFALDMLQDPRPGFIIVDGTEFSPYQQLKHSCFIGGDGKYLSIAAASILAKVFRDEYMATVAHEKYPQYDWAKNKGYGTVKHRDAIRKYGITEFHRQSFKLL